MNDHGPNESVDAVASADAGQTAALRSVDPAADPPATSALRQATLSLAATAGAGANGKRSDDPAGDDSSGDDPAAGGSPSKSQRVRDFLQQHPAAKNKAVAAALAHYGVTPADVANVKSQQKRKQQPSQSAARRSRSSAAPSPRPASAPVAAASSGDDAEQFDLSLSDLERGIAFVRELGSIQRARQAIELLEQIRQIDP